MWHMVTIVEKEVRFKHHAHQNEFCFSFHLSIFKEAFLDVPEEVTFLQGLLAAEPAACSRAELLTCITALYTVFSSQVESL